MRLFFLSYFVGHLLHYLKTGFSKYGITFEYGIRELLRHDLIPEMQDLAAIPVCLTLTTNKQTTKFSFANFKKMLSPSYIILRIQRLGGKQCRCR